MQTFDNEPAPSRRAHGHDSRKPGGAPTEVGWALAAGHHESLQPAGMLWCARQKTNLARRRLIW